MITNIKLIISALKREGGIIIRKILYPVLLMISKTKKCKLPSVEESKLFFDIVRPHDKVVFNVENRILESKYNLTIVVPVYNVEKYLDECVRSLLNQNTNYTYIIRLVNDGSTDFSKKVLEMYIGNEKIEYYEKKNGGVSSARNYGIRTLESDYVMFVDPDDRLEENAVQLLLEKAYTEKLDIVEGNYYYFNQDKLISRANRLEGKLYGFPWNKVINSKLLKHFEFEEGYVFEDTCMVFYLHNLADTIGYIDAYTYGYRRNTQGISFYSKCNYSSLDSMLIVPRLLERMQALKISIDSETLDVMLQQVVNSYNRYHFLDKDIQMNMFVYICNIFDTYFSHLVYNKKIYQRLYQSIIKKDYNLYMLSLRSRRY